MPCLNRFPAPIAVLASALLLGAPHSLDAQGADPGEVAERVRAGIAEADIAGNHDGLAQAVSLARRAVTAFPDDMLVNHYLGYALYRLAGPTMATDVGAALALLEEAGSYLERSIEIKPIAESHALLASTLGMRIVSDDLAMTLGMRSSVELERARTMGPNNPRVRLLQGISAFHSPTMFGGGHDVALEHFLAAIALFAEDAPEPPLPAWGHAEAYAWLGQTSAALGQSEEARAAYERALELEPAYGWVREVLLSGVGG